MMVSIPFIAGQWSLPGQRSPAHRGAGRFNPLHCGAVVASDSLFGVAPRFSHVSIPFIAGQWSLPRRSSVSLRMRAKFQSPSLRGSGRFVSRTNSRRWRVSRFQSPSLRGSGRFEWVTLWRGLLATRFQSPSLRGSGRFSWTWAKERNDA